MSGDCLLQVVDVEWFSHICATAIVGFSYPSKQIVLVLESMAIKLADPVFNFVAVLVELSRMLCDGCGAGTDVSRVNPLRGVGTIA
jgi:hypothetical protein